MSGSDSGKAEMVRKVSVKAQLGAEFFAAVMCAERGRGGEGRGGGVFM